MRQRPVVRRGRFSCAPGMGVDWVVKVHCRRGSTSLLAKGKGVHREVGSEGSWRQTHGPMNKNLIRGYAVRMSWQDKAKSKGCQRAAEYMRRARGEGQRSYPGRPAGYARGLATRIERFG
ncbi:conserved protein of unknown function [Kyrpidia spormannii]|uniref:Uncharacterized protein n=2 Tax=Kyrpidia spormannii TaxID=2055160 RepID=A0ACA8ZB63_9BACL|nr:conserved protein of unknown function [Kyrpidia spormannii]CAB3394555.1 conserved protein of unknown function [Kyrpidia spormannii]